MKITTTRDETTRTIVFHVQDGPVMESPFNSYRARQQRFQVTSGQIYVVEGEVRSVKVVGPLIKKDGTASNTVRDNAHWGTSKLDELPDWLGWGTSKLDELPDWLGIVVTEAVRQVAREWDLQP